MNVFFVSEGYNAEVMPNKERISSIIFYDSQCGLCQWSVKFFLFIDKKESVAFAPLKGKKYIELIPQSYNKYDSILYYLDGDIFIKSEAIINGVIQLGGFYRLIILIKIVPRFILDYGYDLIAKNRNKIKCDLEFLQNNKNGERFYE